MLVTNMFGKAVFRCFYGYFRTVISRKFKTHKDAEWCLFWG